MKTTNKYAQITDINTRCREFLHDTMAFYNINNRAVNEDNRCTYSATNTSPGCAIGRWMEGERPLSGLVANNDRVIKCMPDWMQEMPPYFLRAVQTLHDCRECWDLNGLTELGRKQAALTESFIGRLNTVDDWCEYCKQSDRL